MVCTLVNDTDIIPEDLRLLECSRDIRGLKNKYRGMHSSLAQR